MAVKANATDAVNAWKSGFAGSSTKYQAGIDSVTVAPGQLAAAQKTAYLQGVQANADYWAGKVASVDLGTWKNAAKTTGAARLASGADKGAAKMQSFMAAFLPQLASTVQSLPPRGSFEQNLNRFQQYATQLHQKRGTFR